MQQAHEKILGVTTDAHKVSVIGQIDASTKRIRALKNEMAKLQGALTESEPPSNNVS